MGEEIQQAGLFLIAEPNLSDVMTFGVDGNDQSLLPALQGKPYDSSVAGKDELIRPAVNGRGVSPWQACLYRKRGTASSGKIQAKPKKPIAPTADLRRFHNKRFVCVKMGDELPSIAYLD